MELTKPQPYQQAVDKIGTRSLIGSRLNSEEWAQVPVALRERAFFSSTIENVRFLQRGRDAILDFMKGATEQVTGPDGVIRTALKTGSRADFVKQMSAFALGEGMGPLDPKDAGTLKDIRSERRLNLIFDIQTQQAYSYANWKEGQDPDVLNEFPAQRFIREAEVIKPRAIHQQNEGVVRLKTDLAFWLGLNSPQIGGFGVPWGPWGFGSGMGVEDVDRTEAEGLGLLQPGDAPQPVERDFNDHLEASLRGLDPELIQRVKSTFGNLVEIDGNTVRWRGEGRVRKPKPVKPQPAPTPTPAPAPIKPAKPTYADIEQNLQALSQRYDRANVYEKKALAQDARKALQVPQAERGTVKLQFARGSDPIKHTAQAGAAIIEDYVAKPLLEKLRIEVHRTPDDRAFYRGGEIHLSSYSSDSVAAHEIMHGIELQHPEVLRAAAKFLFKRAGKETAKQLRKLTGNQGYGPKEIAFQDDWETRGGAVYAGKVYSYFGAATKPEEINATEILTMGIERLHRNPLGFYREDPDWFEFVVRTIKQL